VQITSSEAMNDAEVTVQNLYGQVVLKKSLILSEGVNNELISLEREQKGLFIVKVKAGSKIMQSAVTVQ
jgi:hypothetical protein